MPDMRRCEFITLIGGACGGTRRAFFCVSLAMGAEELKQQSIVGFDPCLRKAMTERFTSTVTVQARDRPSNGLSACSFRSRGKNSTWRRLAPRSNPDDPAKHEQRA
jgi:hypothetical protein